MEEDGGTEVEISGIDIEKVLDIKVSGGTDGGKVYVVREEQEGEIITTYVGDEEYWGNKGRDGGSMVEHDADVEIAESMMDMNIHPNCE